MENEPRDRGGAAGSAVFLLAAVVGGLAIFSPPLSSMRPDPPPHLSSSSLASGEDVEARLWNDPLQAVQKARDATDAKDTDLGQVHREYYHSLQYLAEVARSRGRDAGGIVLIGAMIPSAPYAEDSEIRRRTRQAVIMGLARQRFEPRNADKLGYVETRWGRDGCLVPNFGGRVVVPYEEFSRPTAGAPKHAIVLWLPEDAFQIRPLGQLRELYAHLSGFEYLGEDGGSAPSIDYVTIGPASSTTLERMVWTPDEVPCEHAQDGMDPDELGSELGRRLAVVTSFYLDTVPDSDQRVGLSRSISDAVLDVIAPQSAAGGDRQWLPAPNDPDSRTDDTLRAAWQAFRKATLGIGDSDLNWQKVTFSRWAKEAVPKIRGRVVPQEVPELRLLSPRATIADEQLRLDADGVRTELAERRVGFVRTILQDDVLAKAMIEELDTRGIDLSDTDDVKQVVLVSESDTLYGRSLPRTFAAAIACSRVPGSAATWGREDCWRWCRLNADSCDAPQGVLFRSYLRGLDGKGPHYHDDGATDDGKSKSARRSVEVVGQEVKPNEEEQAVGAKQLDHMRRLAASLRAIGSQRRIDAIGVLGSDVYDKQVVLQALRPVFPDSVFFTTDLDARFLNSEAYDWSRNLVVVSSYGLKLPGSVQGTVPPFRDAYQTATFVAASLALGQIPLPCQAEADNGTCRPCVSSSLSAETIGELLAPRIFEISRSGAYDLTPCQQQSQLHPAVGGWKWPPRSGGAWVAIGSGVILLGVLMSSVYRWAGGPRRDANAYRYMFKWLGFTLTLIAVLGALAWLDASHRQGEPFEIWEGISIWPSALFQLLAVLAGAALIQYGLYRLASNRDEITRAYGLTDSQEEHPGFWKQLFPRPADQPDEPDLPGKPLGTFWRRLRSAILELGVGSWKPVPDDTLQGPFVPPPRESATAIWAKYGYLGVNQHRLTRAVPISLLFMGFAWALYLALDPGLSFDDLRPYRGEVARATDAVLMGLGFLVMYLLTFLALDAGDLCAEWIRRMAGNGAGVEWPDDTKKRTAEQRGVRPDDVTPLLNIQIIAQRSEVVSQLITYPFVVMFLLLLSRIQYFESWTWPRSILIILGIVTLAALASGVITRRAAEKARREALDRLWSREIEALREPSRADPELGTDASGAGEARARQIRLLADQVRNIKRGALAPWSRHPVVKAVVLPLTGIGTVAMVNLMATLAR